MENLSNFKNSNFYLIRTIVKNYSGQKTEMFTMFNKSIGWEEACIGVRKGLVHQENIECCKIDVYFVKHGEKKHLASEPTYYFQEERKKYLESLLNTYIDS